MKRNKTYSKEIKIQSCKAYDEENLSFVAISKRIGANTETVRRWYLRFKEHGPSAFDSSKKTTYDKEFILSVVADYATGYYSLANLSAKYNIAVVVIQRWIDKWYNGVETNDKLSKGEVYTMKSKKTTFEERLEIVKWVIENNKNYNEAAEKFSLNYHLVYNWTKAYLKKGPDALKHKKRGPKPKKDDGNLSDLDKIARLEALLKRKELEIEVLKKNRRSRRAYALESKT